MHNPRWRTFIFKDIPLGGIFISYDPTPLNISQADEEETYGENNQQCEIDQHGHRISNAEGAVENVGAVGRRKHVGKRPEKNRQTFNREE